MNAGVCLQQDNKYKIGVQISYSAWANSLSEYTSDVLKNSMKVSVGGEFIPDYISYNNYLKRIDIFYSNKILGILQLFFKLSFQKQSSFID